MATATAGSRKRTLISPGVVLHDVSWDDYEAMLRIVGERPVRVIYDQGHMEVLMPSYRHENDAFLLGHLVGILVDEFDMDFEGGGMTTHKRKDLAKGAEPDDCYWFGDNARRMHGNQQLDLTRDPVPDLVIEVDATRTSLDRLKIFAAMGVPEVWRSTGRSLQFLHLRADGTYQSRATSRSFPGLSATALARFLKEGRTADKRVWSRSFRTFLREKILPGRGPNGR